MKKIKAAIQRIKDRLTGRKADLAKARRRHKVWREHAEELDHKALKRKNHGHAALAAALAVRAKRAHIKAIYWKGRVRSEHDAIHKLEGLYDNLEQELADYIKSYGVQILGHNKIRGGTAPQRSFAVQTQAMINYRNSDATVGPAYYSMEGGPRDYDHAIYHYPPGRIYDCSTYNDGQKKVTGDPSPSGPNGFTAGGYTGTEFEYGTIISEHELRVGDQIIYERYPGDRIGHHVETVYNVKKKQSSGHGDEKIDIGCNGDWNIFGDGNYAFVRPPQHEHNLPA